MTLEANEKVKNTFRKLSESPSLSWGETSVPALDHQGVSFALTMSPS